MGTSDLRLGEGDLDRCQLGKLRKIDQLQYSRCSKVVQSKVC